MVYYDVNWLIIIAKYIITEIKNAVQNMLKIVKSIFNTCKRPEVFSKEKTNADDKVLLYHTPKIF